MNNPLSVMQMKWQIQEVEQHSLAVKTRCVLISRASLSYQPPVPLWSCWLALGCSGGSQGHAWEMFSGEWADRKIGSRSESEDGRKSNNPASSVFISVHCHVVQSLWFRTGCFV